MLPDRELVLLEDAQQGNLPGPWCERPLEGELAYFELEDDDACTDVRISCGCGFLEY